MQNLKIEMPSEETMHAWMHSYLRRTGSFPSPDKWYDWMKKQIIKLNEEPNCSQETMYLRRGE